MSFQSVVGYVDLQVNGYEGIDFNQPQSVSNLRKAAEAMARDAVHCALPTIITGSIEHMIACVQHLRAAIENDPMCASMFRGIHLEGPFLSRKPGFIGAHPVEHALDANIDALDRLLDAGGGWIKLVTLAPEVDQNGALTRFLVDRSILVSAGHTDASMDDLDRCLDAGMTLFTHLATPVPSKCIATTTSSCVPCDAVIDSTLLSSPTAFTFRVFCLRTCSTGFHSTD